MHGCRNVNGRIGHAGDQVFQTIRRHAHHRHESGIIKEINAPRFGVMPAGFFQGDQ